MDEILSRSGSVIARDRAPCGVLVGQVDDHLVDVAPAPALGRIVALDDRMAGGVEVRGRVPVRATGRSSRRGRRCGRGAGAPSPSRSSGTPRSPWRWASRCGSCRWVHARHASLPFGARSARRVGQIGVERGHHLRALADRGGHPLDRAGADVADGEDARQAGLQRRAVGRLGAGAARSPWRPAPRREPASQSVLGSAPMNRNRWRIVRGVASPSPVAPARPPRAPRRCPPAR